MTSTSTTGGVPDGTVPDRTVPPSDSAPPAPVPPSLAKPSPAPPLPAAPPPAPERGFGSAGTFGAAMKNRNPFLVWIVWPILTLGIYHLVWYYKIHDEMLRFDPRQPINPTGSLLTILFGWIIIVPPFVSYFNTGNRIATAQRAAGLPATANPWTGFVLLFLFGLTPLYYQFELNKITDHYRAPEGSPVPLAV